MKFRWFYCVAMLLPLDAWAYFDIGTGSVMFQILFASVAGGIYTARHYLKVLFYKITFRELPVTTEEGECQDEKDLNENR